MAICVLVGLTAGSYVPVLWGASAFGFQSLILGALGGVVGVWCGVKLND